MTMRSCVTVAALVALSCLRASAAEPAAQPAVDLKALEDAQKQLGGDDFDARMQARKLILDVVEQFYLKVAAGLASDNPEIRTGTEDVLKNFDGRLRVARILARLNGEDRAGLRDLLARDPDLLRLLSSGEATERIKGTAKIAGLKDRLAALVLCELTNDSDEQVSKKAVKALGDTGRREGLERLKTLALSTASRVPANSSGAFGMQRVAFGGMAGAGDAAPETRPISRLAIQAIGKIKQPGAANFLLSQLDNPTGGGVSDYLSALGQTGQAAAAVPKLVRYVEDGRKVADLNTAQQRIGGAGAGGIAISSVTMTVNGQEVPQLKVGDVALTAVLALTKQNPGDYGMSDMPAGAMIMMFGDNPLQGIETKCFTNDQARREAIGKLKHWYETWSEKPETESKK